MIIKVQNIVQLHDDRKQFLIYYIIYTNIDGKNENVTYIMIFPLYHEVYIGQIGKVNDHARVI